MTTILIITVSVIINILAFIFFFFEGKKTAIKQLKCKAIKHINKVIDSAKSEETFNDTLAEVSTASHAFTRIGLFNFFEVPDIVIQGIVRKTTQWQCEKEKAGLAKPEDRRAELNEAKINRFTGTHRKPVSKSQVRRLAISRKK